MFEQINFMTKIDELPWSLYVNTTFTILFVLFLFGLIYKKTKNNQSKFSDWLETIVTAAKIPLFILVVLYLVYVTIFLAKFFIPAAFLQYDLLLLKILPATIKWCGVILLLWFFWRLTSIIQLHLQNKNIYDSRSIAHVIIPIINNCLHPIIILIALNIILPELALGDQAKAISEKIVKLIFIGVIGWIFLQVINGVEKIILRQFDISTSTITTRKVQTQVLLLKRVIIFIGALIFLASAMFVFDSVQKLGAGLLTTAGIISAVGAFASQQSLGRLFSGLQLAFTQPIRIGDSVIVDNQNGVVEEISIFYVVVKLWDLKRLIIPTDTIMTRGFQNLSRTSTQLLGTIFFYIDYMLPIKELRHKFNEYVSQSQYWDKNICTLQVTELKESNLEVRGLVSANNGNDLWSLRCEIREKMLEFIVKNYPHCLPKVRQTQIDDTHKAAALDDNLTIPINQPS